MKKSYHACFCDSAKNQFFNLLGIAFIFSCSSAFCSASSPDQIPHSASSPSRSAEGEASAFVTLAPQVFEFSNAKAELFSAVAWGDIERLKYAVQDGATVETRLLGGLISSGSTSFGEIRHESIFPILMNRCKFLHKDPLPLIKYIVETCSFNVKYIDRRNGCSILQDMFTEGCITSPPFSVVQYFLDQGVPINNPNTKGETLLTLVKKRKRTDLVDFLISRGASEEHPVIFHETAEQTLQEEELEQSVQKRIADIQKWLAIKKIVIDEDVEKKVVTLAERFYLAINIEDILRSCSDCEPLRQYVIKFIAEHNIKSVAKVIKM